MCKWYRICSEGIDGYTLEDLYSAIVLVNFRNDFIKLPNTSYSRCS